MCADTTTGRPSVHACCRRRHACTRLAEIPTKRSTPRSGICVRACSMASSTLALRRAVRHARTGQPEAGRVAHRQRESKQGGELADAAPQHHDVTPEVSLTAREIGESHDRCRWLPHPAARGRPAGRRRRTRAEGRRCAGRGGGGGGRSVAACGSLTSLIMAMAKAEPASAEGCTRDAGRGDRATGRDPGDRVEDGNARPGR